MAVSSSHVIQRINYIIQNKIPAPTISDSRANPFSGKIRNGIITNGIKQPFPPNLPGFRSRHRNWRPHAPDGIVVSCINTKVMRIVFLLGDHSSDSSNTVDIFMDAVNLEGKCIAMGCGASVDLGLAKKELRGNRGLQRLL